MRRLAAKLFAGVSVSEQWDVVLEVRAGEQLFRGREERLLDMLAGEVRELAA